MATAEFCVFYDYDGKDACNTGYVIHDALTIADFQAVANAVWTNWCANIMPSLVTAIETTQMTMKDVAGPWEANAVTASTKTGGNVGAGLPPNCAVAINRTDSSSRFKGRWFMPGIPETVVDNAGVVTAAFGSNLAAQFAVTNANILATFNARLANRHKVGAVPGSFAYVSVDSFSYIATVASQKQRRF